MHTTAIVVAMLTLATLSASASDEQAPIPDDCPVTLPTEPRFIPPVPHTELPLGGPMFWYGSDPLFTHIYSDGRWRGIQSPSGTRNKSFWYRKGMSWHEEQPYQLLVTARRIDADAPMVTVSRVNNAIMGDQWAMLLMLELPGRGCWEVTGNYRSDDVSFVVWVD